MSSFGRFFRVTTFGESHSPQVGVIVEGFPSNFKVCQDDLQRQLNRRRPGQSSLTTPRDEKDKVKIQSGLENSYSLGTPIAMTVNNEDYIKKDYSNIVDIPRPGHAEYTYFKKYGIKAESGGGRSSARETVGRVCAGALAEQYLQKKFNIKIYSFVSSVGKVKIPKLYTSQDDKNKQENIIQKFSNLGQQQVDQLSTFQILENQIYQNCGQFYNKNGQPVDCKSEIESLKQKFEQNQDKIEIINVRCPHPETAIKMIQKIQEVKAQKDSIGGTVTCIIQNLPAGLGEPCFDKLEALLAHAMLSIPATKGFEIGSGFEGTEMQGSQHNDPFQIKNNDSDIQDNIQTKDNSKNQEKNKQTDLICKTNNHGGTLGGISSGNDIYFKVAFKPVSTIGIQQQTCDMNGNQQVLEAKGRHDPCVLPRAPPIVDAMGALVIMDLFQAQKLNQQI